MSSMLTHRGGKQRSKEPEISTPGSWFRISIYQTVEAGFESDNPGCRIFLASLHEYYEVKGSKLTMTRDNLKLTEQACVSCECEGDTGSYPLDISGKLLRQGKIRIEPER